MAIHYDVASAQHAQQAALTKSTRHLQAVALNEFRNSYCDMFTMRNLLHYMNATGKELRWLFRHARFKHPSGPLGAMAQGAIRDGDIELQEFILLNCW